MGEEYLPEARAEVENECAKRTLPEVVFSASLLVCVSPTFNKSNAM